MVKFRCPPDCPDRCITCHTDCKHGYIEFREQRNKELEELYRQRELEYTHRRNRFYMKKDTDGNCVYATRRIQTEGKRKKG